MIGAGIAGLSQLSKKEERTGWNIITGGLETGVNDVEIGTNYVEKYLKEGDGHHGQGPQASSSLHINEKTTGWDYAELSKIDMCT